ncbi:MAG: hypothetical protein CSA42_07765 [Gammaproteobacteria bacterium]|nr:MAG: hypothetical protein CSA42_07765 [Gammaproteobacteria bacterium]
MDNGEDLKPVVAGSKGNWSRTLNNKTPKANTTFKVKSGNHTHLYHTDSRGRVNKVEGQLDLNKMDRNRYQQKDVGKLENATGDDGGHLIASTLGGAGDRINIVPQASTLNRGDWKAMEDHLRKELKAGKTVSVKIDVGYPNGNTKRPNKFFVTATIDGVIKTYPFRQ